MTHEIKFWTMSTTLIRRRRSFLCITIRETAVVNIWNQWRSKGASFCWDKKKPFCQFHKMFSSINLMLLWGFLLLNYSVALESSPGFLSRMHPTLLLRYSVSENIPEGGVVSDFSDNSVHVSLKSWTLCTYVWFIGKFSLFQRIKLLLRIINFKLWFNISLL